MLKTLALASLLVAQTATATITKTSADRFVIKYPAGAEWSCVVFRMTQPTETNTEIWPDGHYAPRSCGPVDPKSTFFVEEWSPYIQDPQTGKDYNVDWEVFAILQYPEKGRTDAFTEIETNRVSFHR
jgi:hypothetical protein